MNELIIFTAYLVVLFIGCLISDYIFPHIKPLQRYLDSLPDFEEDEEPEAHISSWEESA